MSSPVSFSQADIDAAVLKAKEEAKAEAKKEAELEFSAQVNEANQKAATIEGERRAERISAQIESWKKEGKVLPAETSGMAEFMASLDGGSAFEFSASDGEKKSKSASEWFAEFMAKQPKRIDLNRQSATEDGDPQPKTAEELAAKALEFQKEKADKGIVISISEAMSAVTGE